MSNFLHSGSLGDIIYSLPTVRALGGGTMWIKDALLFDGYTQFDAIARLLYEQPYITAVKRYPAQYEQFTYDPDIHIDYDLDKARLQKDRARIHIVRRHLDAMGVHIPKLVTHQIPGWKSPWLTVRPIEEVTPYYLIHLTPRYRTGSRVNWRQVIEAVPGNLYVLGYDKEYQEVCAWAGKLLPRLKTPTLWEMAIAIGGCEALLCNQSVALTIAQGLGKKYYLERHPLRTNCLFYTSNENLL